MLFGGEIILVMRCRQVTGGYQWRGFGFCVSVSHSSVPVIDYIALQSTITRYQMYCIVHTMDRYVKVCRFGLYGGY